MRKSKYVNKQFGNWTCVGIEVYKVQPVFLKGSKVRSARPYHQCYTYIFQAKSGLAVRLNFAQAVKVYRGERTVESYIASKNEVSIRY